MEEPEVAVQLGEQFAVPGGPLRLDDLQRLLESGRAVVQSPWNTWWTSPNPNIAAATAPSAPARRARGSAARNRPSSAATSQGSASRPCWRRPMLR
ncbi:MAG: hypothetical protein ACREOV_12285 [Candidatus Dormibacteraceae bacterium]